MGPVSGVPPASPGPARVLAFQPYVIAVLFYADREMAAAGPAVQDCIGGELGRDKHQVIRNRTFTEMLGYVTADMAHLISTPGVIAFEGDRLGCPGRLYTHGLAPPFVPAW
jgi:hypothetical protein